MSSLLWATISNYLIPLPESNEESASSIDHNDFSEISDFFNMSVPEEEEELSQSRNICKVCQDIYEATVIFVYF